MQLVARHHTMLAVLRRLLPFVLRRDKGIDCHQLFASDRSAEANAHFVDLAGLLVRAVLDY